MSPRGCMTLVVVGPEPDTSGTVLLRVSEVSSVLDCVHHVSWPPAPGADGALRVEARAVPGALVTMRNGTRHEIAHTQHEVEKEMDLVDAIDRQRPEGAG